MGSGFGHRETMSWELLVLTWRDGEHKRWTIPLEALECGESIKARDPVS